MILNEIRQVVEMKINKGGNFITKKSFKKSKHTSDTFRQLEVLGYIMKHELDIYKINCKIPQMSSYKLRKLYDEKIKANK